MSKKWLNNMKYFNKNQKWTKKLALVQLNRLVVAVVTVLILIRGSKSMRSLLILLQLPSYKGPKLCMCWLMNTTIVSCTSILHLVDTCFKFHCNRITNVEVVRFTNMNCIMYAYNITMTDWLTDQSWPNNSYTHVLGIGEESVEL